MKTGDIITDTMKKNNAGNRADLPNMNEGEKINAIHALQNVLNPRMAGSERVKILTEDQENVVKDKLIELVKELKVK